MRIQKKLMFGLLLSVPFIAALLIIPKVTFADVAPSDINVTVAKFSFVDGGTITGDFGDSGTVTFIDRNTTDDTHNYKPLSGGFCQPDGIGDDDYGINIAKGADLEVAEVPIIVNLGYKVGANCKMASFSNGHKAIAANLNNPVPPAATDFVWDDDKITTFKGAKETKNFILQPNTQDRLYGDESDDNCGFNGLILLNPGSDNLASYYELEESSGAVRGNGGNPSNLGSFPAIKDFLKDPSKCRVVGNNKKLVSIAGKKGEAAPNPGGVTTGGASEDSCTTSPDVTSLNWIACGVLAGIDDAVKVLNDSIEGQLNFDTAKYLPDDGGVHTAWSIMKNLSTAILVIIMLVMVISQAIGGGPFDAYTIRKVLPRLVVAVIITQVSWELLIFLIGLANDVGQAVKELLFVPFGGSNEMSLENLLRDIGWAAPGLTTGAIFGVIIAIKAFSGLTIIGVGLIAVTVLLGVFIAFTVLVLRQVLITLCVILAPIAIVLWILPGTQRYYKLWSDNVSKLLMLFPIIMGLIASGRVFAHITATTHTGTGKVIAFIIVFIGFFGPYFFLPKAFKWGGTAMSAVSGAAYGATQWRKKPQQFGLSQAKANRHYNAEQRNKRLSFGQENRGDRFIANLGGYGLNRGAKEHRLASQQAEGREAASKAVQQSIIGSKYENAGHGEKLVSLDTIAQGGFDERSELDGSDPTAQRFALEELAKFGDWDRIDAWRLSGKIDKRTWEDFVGKNISGIHQNVPHLSPIKRDLSKLGYSEAGNWKEWTGDEFVRQITDGKIRSPDGKSWEDVTGEDRRQQIKNGKDFATRALNDERVLANLSPKLRDDFAKIRDMEIPEVAPQRDRGGRITGVSLPNAAALRTDPNAQQSLTNSLFSGDKTLASHTRQAVGEHIAGLDASHPDRQAYEAYLDRLRDTAETSGDPRAKEAYNEVVNHWNQSIDHSVENAVQELLSKKDSKGNTIATGPEIRAARDAAQLKAQSAQQERIKAGFDPLP